MTMIFEKSQYLRDLILCEGGTWCYSGILHSRSPPSLIIVFIISKKLKCFISSQMKPIYQSLSLHRIYLRNFSHLVPGCSTYGWGSGVSWNSGTFHCGGCPWGPTWWWGCWGRKGSSGRPNSVYHFDAAHCCQY